MVWQLDLLFKIWDYYSKPEISVQWPQLQSFYYHLQNHFFYFLIRFCSNISTFFMFRSLIFYWKQVHTYRKLFEPRSCTYLHWCFYRNIVFTLQSHEICGDISSKIMHIYVERFRSSLLLFYFIMCLMYKCIHTYIQIRFFEILNTLK